MQRSCVVAVAITWFGCASPESVPCANGLTCPEGTECKEAVGASGDMLNLCVDPLSVPACDGMADGAMCTWGEVTAGTCHGGACVENACGNLLQDTGEACDDGNNTSDDDCSADCVSNESCGNGYVDSIRFEQCDDANVIGHDGCASNCKAEAPVWQQQAPYPVRDLTELVYDGARQRVVAFGGTYFDASANVIYSPQDTREWDGTHWRTVSSITSPVSRAGHVMAYDEERKVVVLYGGGGSDTWELDAAGWHQRVTPATPGPRNHAQFVYDSARKRLVLFGGGNREGLGAGTWTWDGRTWTQFVSASPAPRTGHAMAYDRKRNVVVMFGGVDDNPLDLVNNELWELSDTTWTKKTFTGAAPLARRDAAMAWDPFTERVLLVGGNDTDANALKDTWTWDGTSWTQLASVTGAIAFSNVGLATDHARKRIVMLASDGAVREYNGSSWQLSTAVPAIGVPRHSAAMALDTRHRELVLFGGQTTTGASFSNATYRFRGQWTLTTVTGPAARAGHRLVYDRLRDEMVMFGGYMNSTFFADTHVLPGPTATAWVARAPQTSPSARYGHAMVWDDNIEKVVLFGGDDGAIRNDTWTWNGANWNLEAPPSKPTIRKDAAVAYDPVQKKVVLFGGRTSGGVVEDDTWLWDGSTWTELTTGARPPAREGASMAWDPARKHVVLFGGGVNATYSDAWELTDAGWQVVATSASIQSRAYHMMATAPEGAGVIVVGGAFFEANTMLGDTQRLRWDGPEAAEEVCAAIDFDGDGLAGCADPDCGYACGRCGNISCDVGVETCSLCPMDCGVCSM